MSEDNINDAMDSEDVKSIADDQSEVKAGAYDSDSDVVEKNVAPDKVKTGYNKNYNKSYNKGQMQSDQNHKVPRFKKKICRFCHETEVSINYKKPDLLERFITDRGKILPRRVTGTCAKHQRIVAREIKRARLIALLPFIEK